MKFLLLPLILLSSNIYAYEIFKDNGSEVSGNCSDYRSFIGTYSNSFPTAHVCDSYKCYNGNTLDEAINKVCSNKSTSSGQYLTEKSANSYSKESAYSTKKRCIGGSSNVINTLIKNMGKKINSTPYKSCRLKNNSYNGVVFNNRYHMIYIKNNKVHFIEIEGLSKVEGEQFTTYLTNKYPNRMMFEDTSYDGYKTYRKKWKISEKCGSRDDLRFTVWENVNYSFNNKISLNIKAGCKDNTLPF